jgi:CBS domain containing-hemolysin-like protein
VLDANPEERRMIRAILELEDVTAREVMVPRVDIVAVEADTPLHHVASSMAQGGHSRIPVFKETIDNIVGVVHARDVLQSMVSGNGPGSLTELSRTPLFIPESKPLDELLRELRETRVSIAIVVDEYGGTEGVLTIEDLLEEIVGEIEDEFQTEEPPIIKLTESEAIVDGRVNLEELNDLFQTSLEGDGFDTLAGLLSSHLGRIPVPGDTLDLEGLAMRVLSASGRRVRKVSVAQHP